jgi:hypothetical protein
MFQKASPSRAHIRRIISSVGAVFAIPIMILAAVRRWRWRQWFISGGIDVRGRRWRVPISTGRWRITVRCRLVDIAVIVVMAAIPG